MIYKLFSIRFEIWDSKTISESDQTFWDEARALVPEYPLFRRLQLSTEDRQAQDEVECKAIAGFEALCAGAKEVQVTKNEHGFNSFSVTIDLTKDQGTEAGRHSWWKRLWFWT